jgi:LysR family glycine cleavage system transcriptional activator
VNREALIAPGDAKPTLGAYSPGIPMLPSLQALRILEAATRLRSYTAAAKELGLTHGAVSRQMQALERWAGAQLFERRGPNMEPTASGLALTARTREGLRILGDAFSAPPRAGGLIVSAAPAFACTWLIPRLPLLHAEHPGLIRAIEAETTLFESFDRKIDLAVRSGVGGWPDVQYECICPDEVFPVATPAVAAGIDELNDFLRLPLIETPYHSWRSWLTAAGVADTAHFKSSLSLSDPALALEAAMTGLGIALTSSRLVGRRLAEGRLVRAHRASLIDGTEYYLVWRSNPRQRNRVDQLREWLRREITADQPGGGKVTSA